jgi:hypothetical protein
LLLLATACTFPGQPLERLPALVAELVRLRVDAIFVSGDQAIKGSPILQFLDPRGNTRAWMGAMADGKAQVVLTSRPTQGSIPSNATLEVAADGMMILRFFRAGTIWKAP